MLGQVLQNGLGKVEKMRLESEQVNFHEMDTAFGGLSLLASVKAPSRAILFIRRAQELNTGNQSVAGCFKYFQEDLLNLDNRPLNVDRLICMGMADCRLWPGSL